MARHPRERFTVRLDRPATWDDLLDVPEGFIGEILAGEMVVSPRPGTPHGHVSSGLGVLLGGPFGYGIGGPGGWVLLDEPRIRFGEEIRVPDLAGWREERFSASTAGPIAVVPDWICEVLSPRTESDDRGSKMDLYGRAGVGHLWLVGWVARTVEVYRLGAEGWFRAVTFGGDTKVRAQPFDEIEIDLSLLWRRLPPMPSEE